MASGRPAFGDRFHTANEEHALLARGFQHGTAPGALVVGWNKHHTAVTLPDGTPVSSGEGGGVKIGGGGAYQRQFTHHMFLPMDVAPPVAEPAPPFPPMFAPPPGAEPPPLGVEPPPLGVPVAFDAVGPPEPPAPLPPFPAPEPAAAPAPAPVEFVDTLSPPPAGEPPVEPGDDTPSQPATPV